MLKRANTCVLPFAMACMLHVCPAVSSRVQVQCHRVVEKFSSKQLHSIPSAKLLNRSLRASFVWLAYESNYRSAANSMPSYMRNEVSMSTSDSSVTDQAKKEGTWSYLQFSGFQSGFMCLCTIV